MRMRVAATVALASGVAAALAACSVGASPRGGERAVGSGGRALPPVSSPIGPVDNAYVLASKVVLPVTKPGEEPGLHNVFRLSGNVISGSEPDGEAAFEHLAALGVRTVLSVDGKVPDAATAAKHGMRYVHIPIEYRGLTDEELLQLAKTFRECEAPIYAHCFHGKHRGPAAAAVGRLVLDGAGRERAIAEMRQWCGTAPEYEGLYRDVAAKLMPSEAETSAYAFDFPAARRFGGFREAMVDVARRDDALKLLLARDWAVDPAHPDVDALNEATKLATTLAASRSEADAAARPDDFQRWLAQSAELSARLAAQIEAVRASEPDALDASRRTYAELAKTCVACHAQHRNR